MNEASRFLVVKSSVSPSLARSTPKVTYMSLTIHSALLDNHAGSAIFEKVITGELKNKTVILVTNALQYLPKANQVVVLGDGKMQEIGTTPSLMAKKKWRSATS